MKKFLQIPLIAFFAFAGGFTAQIVLTSTPALATAATQTSAKLFSYFKMNDDKNSKAIEMSVKQGVPEQTFITPDGVTRLQLGMYNVAGELPSPVVTLNDRRGSVRMLLRLAGPYDSPVLIFKDHERKDRIILGMSPNDGKEPFLATFDSAGKKTNVFGKY